MQTRYRGWVTAAGRSWLLLLLGGALAVLLSNIVIDGWYWHTLARQLRGSSHVVDATLHTTDAAETVVLGSSAAHYGIDCLLYTSPSPRDSSPSRMPSSA